jgi:hypothetical protein
MRKNKNQSSRETVALRRGVFVSVVIAITSTSVLLGRPSPKPRLLADNELQHAFGDSTGKCRKSLPCTQYFKSGTTKCCKCVNNRERSVCCNSSESGTCDYGTNEISCPASERVCFNLQSSDNECLTCQPGATPSPTTNCDTIQEAAFQSAPCM